MIHILGGNGFVGGRLSSVLEVSNHRFRIFDKSLTGDSYVDVSKPETLASLAPAEIVINLAAEHRDDVSPTSLYNLVNVEGASNVCDYCRRVNTRMIIFTSSVAVYGFAPEGTDETGICEPFNDYGRSKLAAEAVYREWQMEDPEHRTLVIVRPTVIFGEGNRGNLYNLFNQIASKRFIMFGSGKNRKSLAYIQNVAEFLAFSVSFKPGLFLYNYVDTPDLDMNSLVSRIRWVLFGRYNEGLRLPGWVGILIGFGFDVLAKITRRTFPVNSMRVRKFMKSTSFSTSIPETGFHPSVSLEEGIEATLRNEFIN